MKIFDKIHDIQDEIRTQKTAGFRIGFVPTMGALHSGHLALVRQAASECDRVVVSIFVNPTQFNNPEDLKNYPRMPEADIGKLRSASVSDVFIPATHEIYPHGTETAEGIPDAGSLATVMEGAFRPGHFQGVMQVVKRLFEIVKPDAAFFGEKDFQQLTIIRFMTRELGLPVVIASCPTIREPDGLAMSSRNLLLSEEQRKAAPGIYKALCFVRDNQGIFSVEEIKKRALAMIHSNVQLKAEYLEFAEEDTLHPVTDWDEASVIRCFTAVHAGKIRLIDNIRVIPANA